MNLEHIPILDHHAHALFREEIWRKTPIEAYLTEAYNPIMLERYVPDNVFARRSIRELAGFYGCEPTRAAVVEARAAWNYTDLARAMFAQTNIEQVLVDDGIWLEAMQSLKQNAAMIGLPCKRVLRLETELAALVPKHDSWVGLMRAFEEMLRELAPTLVGLKSIIAYRTGLEIMRHDSTSLERAYSSLKYSAQPGIAPRVNDKALLDEMVWLGLRIAAETGLPVQFHTGYGDPDLDLRLANPLHLRPIFEAPELAGLRVVMLHCYPFVREAGYLASVYPGAFMDLGLTIPYMSSHAMLTSAREALHLAPITKILFSTDASRTPELFWLGAKHGRRIIGQALELTVNDNDLTSSEAEWAANRILHDNALELYRL
jgi:uncharacterized protein